MLLQYLCAFGPMLVAKVKGAFSDERGEVNIVAIVVLIGIAVLLALVFKGQVSDLLKTLFQSITESANKAVTQE